MKGPLQGLVVIEMAALGPVPLAGQLMADLGASVTIIDRSSAPADPTDINRRNKQAQALNLKSEAGLQQARELIGKADVLIEGFRPGVMERLGLGPQDLHAFNPGLIFGRMTGWGQTGPLANTAGHDINYLAITGALHAIGRRNEPPVPPLNLAADYGGGAMFLIMGVLSALYERNTTGKGQVIDAAMIEGVPAMMGLIQQMFARGQWQQQRESNMLDGGAPYYRCYETKDNKYLSVGAIEPQFFKQLVELAGLPQTDLAIQNDQSQWPAMAERYAAHFKTRTRDEWCRIFEGSDACVAPVLDFDEAAQHPHNVARGVFVSPDGVLQTRPVPVFNKSET
jgi:alpha-methylacyl-CoA racemase